LRTCSGLMCGEVGNQSQTVWQGLKVAQ